jgi:hypothetical protein
MGAIVQGERGTESLELAMAKESALGLPRGARRDSSNRHQGVARMAVRKTL